MFRGGFYQVTKLLTNHDTVSTEDLFHSNLYTVEKFAVLLNCKEHFYQCKSEHKPGTTFVHLLFTADYFYQRRTPALNIL
jgi:hypothetical protein